MELEILQDFLFYQFKHLYSRHFMSGAPEEHALRLNVNYYVGCAYNGKTWRMWCYDHLGAKTIFSFTEPNGLDPKDDLYAKTKVERALRAVSSRFATRYHTELVGAEDKDDK